MEDDFKLFINKNKNNQYSLLKNNKEKIGIDIQSFIRKYALKNRKSAVRLVNSRYRYVDYSGLYPAFKNQKNEIPVFCSCCREIIEEELTLMNNHEKIEEFRKINEREPSIHWRIKVVKKICEMFPRDLIKSMNYEVLFEMDCLEMVYIPYLLSILKFEDGVCQDCKIKKSKTKENIPLQEFKVMYDGYLYKFKRELGIYSFDGFVNGGGWLERVKVGEVVNSREMIELIKNRLGYKRLSDKWINELKVYLITKNHFENYNVIHQYRPSFLKNGRSQQSIDVFIEGLNIGIEYQGKQHFEPVEIFGGEEGLSRTVERDIKKARLCEENGVKLIYFKYDEELTYDLIINRISKLSKSVNHT